MSASASSRIKRTFRTVVCGAVAVVLCATVGAVALIAGQDPADAMRDEVLELNEARAIVASAASDAQGSADAQDANADVRLEVVAEADGALAHAQGVLRHAVEARRASTWSALALVALTALAALGMVAAHLYRSVVGPFLRLERFAEAVAEGDLDAPLRYERTNPFGSFAWAFDHMRVELKRSRAAEAAASEAHKTALASLSHDLRTPLAALRAHAEALEMGLARTPEERASYERLIVERCDEAAVLVEDLLSHALADMERLEVTPESIPVVPVLARCVEGSSSIMSVCLTRADEAVLWADPKRLAQAVDNLMANALKYAPGCRVEVSGCASGDAYRICVRDFGPGMAPEDLPFATDRFYRGANAADEPGAGLGLFIADHLVQRMGGHLHLSNAHPGLCVTLELPITSETRRSLMTS